MSGDFFFSGHKSHLSDCCQNSASKVELFFFFFLNFLTSTKADRTSFVSHKDLLYMLQVSLMF